ncbi:MAG: hypothetical protein E7464_03810 [Ruminococcaceae bacterium]|nr:hypothetical protein [Oscillospiraceae bacterium]
MALSFVAVLALVFFTIILGSIIFFIVSLVLYTTAKRDFRELPRPELQKSLSTRKVLLIVSSIIMGTLLAVLLTFVIVLYSALAYI